MNKKIYLGILIFLLFIIGCGSQEPVELEEYVSEEDGFSVLMAGEPEIQTTPTEQGITVKTHVSLVNSIPLTASSTLLFDKETAEKIDGETKEEFYNGIIDSLGERIYAEDVMISGHDCKEFLVKKSLLYLNYRLCLVDGTLFQVFATGTKKSIEEPVVREFLDSFKILE